MTTKPPTRAQHLAECSTISIALIAYVHELHEIAKHRVDTWTPAPAPMRHESGEKASSIIR